MRGILRVEIVVLPAFASILPIGGDNLEELDVSILQVPKQTGAISAGTLNAYTLERAEGPHPGEHFLVPLPRRGKALAAENMVVLVDDGGNMQIFMSVDPARDGASGGSVISFHVGSSQGAIVIGLPRANARTGQ
jgi:hypothetical protein